MSLMGCGCATPGGRACAAVPPRDRPRYGCAPTACTESGKEGPFCSFVLFCRALGAYSPASRLIRSFGVSALDQLVSKLLSTRSLSLTAFPALTTEAVAEALGVLAAHDADPGIFAEAIDHLAMGVTITADGDNHLIDGVRVHRAPLANAFGFGGQNAVVPMRRFE
jgi:hypothetical protein